METELVFGGIGAALIITIVLMIVYNFIPDIQNKWKILIAVLFGLGFGLLKVWYDGLPWTVVHIVNNLLQGFLVGAGAVGLNQMQRNIAKPK